MRHRIIRIILSFLLAQTASGITIVMRDDSRIEPRLVIGQKVVQSAVADLAAYDRNKDGWLSSRDPVWNDLSLWYDRNRNGRMDSGEVIKVSYTPLHAISLTQGKAELILGHKKVFRAITAVAQPRRKRLRLAFRDDALR